MLNGVAAHPGIPSLQADVSKEAILIVNHLGVVTAGSSSLPTLLGVQLRASSDGSREEGGRGSSSGRGSPGAGEVEIPGLEVGGEGKEAVVGGKIVMPLVEPVAFQDLFFSINSREDFMILGE